VFRFFFLSLSTTTIGGHCFECDSCLRGNFNLCKNEAITGITKEGGYAEYLVTGWESLARVPDSLTSVEAAPLMCAGITVFNSLRNLKVSPGSLVAVLGIGGLGHLAIQFANRSGFRVVAVSGSDDKTELAKELGAHHFINSKTSNLAEELKKLGGAKVVIATAFNSKLQEEALNGLGTDGTLLCLAPDHNPLQVHVGPLLGRRAGIRMWPSGSAIDSEDTMEFAALTNVKTYVEEFPFERVQEGYDRMFSSSARFRAVLTFPQ
jgi:propanol-preferring alcohol dehydrogenase